MMLLLFWKEKYLVAVYKDKGEFSVLHCTGLGTTFYNGTVATDEDLWNSPFHESICEDYLATRWFVNRYAELTGETITGAKDLLDKPEELRNKMFDEYADSFAEFILKYVKYYDPGSFSDRRQYL